MSDFFKDLEDNTKNVETELLGPTYQYYKHIKSPSQMGMSSDGTLDSLVKNASGLISYVELLVSGTGAASSTGGPLGDQYFLKTAATCKDIKSGDNKTRYVYINNIPTGNIPFISEGSGMDFPEVKGLIPAVLQDMEELNPFSLFKGFLAGSDPDCQEITLSTTPSSINNNQTKQTNYVTNSDIKDMDPCLFTLSGLINPVTKEECREAFSTISYNKDNRDPILQAYVLIISMLGLYIVYKLQSRSYLSFK